MKTINNFINEKLKINSKSKVHNLKPLEPDEIKGPETIGKDYFDEDVTIIGWPFQKPKDDNHKRTIQYIKSEGYQIWNDYNDIEDADMFEWFVYANREDDDTTVDCYVYGPEGVIGYEEK